MNTTIRENINYLEKAEVRILKKRIEEQREEITKMRILLSKYKTRLKEEREKSRYLKEQYFARPESVDLEYSKIFDLAYEATGTEISKSLIEGNSRLRELVNVRHVMMWIMCKHTDLALRVIGLLFNGRDHSTVINARDNVINFIETEKNFAQFALGSEKRFIELYKDYVGNI